MSKSRIKELEDTILDQIEKLNDDSIADDPEAIRCMIDRSNAIAQLTDSFVGINRMKLDVVKELNKNGSLYENYLGITDAKI